MRSRLYSTFLCATGILMSGCSSGGLTPNQKAQANKQWNDARADVLASLASDQYKDGSLDKCQTTLEQALRLEPDSPNLHLLAAKLAIEQSNLEAAQEHLAEVHTLDPKNAEADYLLGVVYQRWEQLEHARAAYADAVAKNPAELSYLLANAEMLVALGKPGEALELLQSKALVFEHSGVIRDEIGQLLIQQNRYDEGIAELREASILSSDDATIREHLAFALFANKQFSESGECFERLMKEPGYEKRADVFAAMGECQSRDRRFPQARENYELATQINPSCYGYWLGLAKTCVQEKDLPSAEIAVRRALSLQPDSSEARCVLGLVKLKQNQLPESLAAFREAAELNPQDSFCVCLQGYLCERMGRVADARSFYSHALRIDPHNELASRLRSSIAQLN
jgi:Flp pilus assembly protein TadD